MAKHAKRAPKAALASGGEVRLKRPNHSKFAWICVVILTVFFFVTLFGCTVTGLDDVYLIQLEGTNITQNEFQNLQVQIGYFAMCAGTATNSTCAVTPGRSNETLPTLFNVTSGPGITKLLAFSLKLQTEVFLYVLCIAAGLFIFSVFFLILFSRHGNSSPSKVALRKRLNNGLGTLIFALGSFAFALTSVVSMSEVAETVDLFAANLDDSVLQVSAGTAMKILQWFTVAFLVLYVCCVVGMIGWFMRRNFTRTIP